MGIDVVLWGSRPQQIDCWSIGESNAYSFLKIPHKFQIMLLKKHITYTLLLF